MKKIAATIITIMMLILPPGIARADVDVISNISDAMNTVMEKANEVTKRYTTIQANLQELSLNRNIITQLRDKAENELKSRAAKFYNDQKDALMSQGMMFLKSSLSSISLPGIGKYVDMGAFVNPKLSSVMGNTYLKKQHQKDDVKYTMEADLRSNNLMIENEAVLFANSLVRRVQIIEEDPCRCMDSKKKLISDMPKCTQTEVDKCNEMENELKNMKDVASVKQKYFDTMFTAHNRWLRIQEALSVYSKMGDEGELNKGNVDDVTAITGEMPESQGKEESEYDAAKALRDKNREANTLALADFTSRTINDIKNKNYTGVLSDVSQGVTTVYTNSTGSREGVGNVMQSITMGTQSLDNAYHSNSAGGSVAASLGGIGSIVSNSGAGTVGSVFSNSAGSTGATVNSVINNDWGGFAGNLGGAAGSAVSSTGKNNEVIGAWINTTGSLTGVGIDAGKAGGNVGNVLDNTVGNWNTQNAIGGLEGAYKAQNQRKSQLVDEAQKREDAAKKAADEAAQKAAEEAAKKAAEEAARKAAEARNKAIEEEHNKQMQELCADCIAKQGANSATCKYWCAI